MTSTKKRIAILIIVAAYAFSLISGAAYMLTNGVISAFAETTNDYTYQYYYDNLVITDSKGKTSEYTLAKRFYEVLDGLNKSGDFKKGTFSYDLGKILTSEQISAWVENGNLEIPKAFGAARDSYLMDHPELFYIDVYKIMISAGRTGGKYVAYLDSGKEPNVYRDGTKLKSESAVNAAIVEYNNAVKKAAEEAQKAIEGQTASRDFLLANAVNDVISKTTYDFKLYESALSGQNEDGGSLSYTAYGALVKSKAVCSGFAFAYKAVMDYLGVPCIVVSGYSVGKDKKGNDTGNDVGHSWNYVMLETGKKTDESADAKASARSEGKNHAWFAYDTTWNSVQRSRVYTAMDYTAAAKQHMPYQIISSSNYALNYPSLSSVNYGNAIDPNEMNTQDTIGSFIRQTKYRPSGTTYLLDEFISYNGKNAVELFETEGLRLITRVSYANDKGEILWWKWQDVYNYTQYYLETSEEAFGHKLIDGETAISIAHNVVTSQYAIVSGVEPDYGYASFDALLANVEYNDGTIKQENIVFLSQEFDNAIYGTYTPAPYIMTDSTKPSMNGVLWISDSLSESGNSSVMQDKHATVITIKYDEALHVLDETKDIEVFFTPAIENAREYASFVKFPDGKYVHLIADENGVMNTLQFKFKPSLMYEHDRSGYAFTFGNVGSAKIVNQKQADGSFVKTTSDRTPNYAYYVWARDYYACPKVFGDGRLWVDCCALPQLVDNSDLAAMNFKDEDGKTTFTEDARSQMMLVVNNVSTDTKNEMLDEIVNSDSAVTNASEIKSSQTYDINLQICGKITSIPDGSYVKIALGFPEGYGPDSEGTTFKLYHRKHIKETDTYVIEEIPCVVTKFGIVATVTSFSPYMVAALPENKASASKTIYASVDGKGGKLTLDDGKIQTLKAGESYTYTIAPDEGYKLYSVTLNGQNVTDKVKDGKLKVSYADLNGKNGSNELTVQYISNEAATRYEENKLEVVEPVKVVVSVKDQSDFFQFDQEIKPSEKPVTPPVVVDPVTPTEENPSETWIVIGLVVCAIVIVAASIAIVVLKKKK